MLSCRLWTPSPSTARMRTSERPCPRAYISTFVPTYQAAAGNALTTTDRDELARLRRENKQLRVERDILARVAAWFAGKIGAVPSGFSGL